MDCKNLEVGDVIVFNENAQSLAFFYIEECGTDSLAGRCAVIQEIEYREDLEDYAVFYYLLINGQPFYNKYGGRNLFMFWLDTECERNSFKITAKTKDTHVKVSQHD